MSAIVESMESAPNRAVLPVLLAVSLSLSAPTGSWAAVRQQPAGSETVRQQSAEPQAVRQELAGPEPVRQESAEREIRSVLERYLEGHATGRAASFEAAFHPEAELLWVADGALRTRTAEDYIAGASGRPADDEQERARRIAWIDVAGDMAVARIELDYPGVFFVDYMTLARVEGSWRIVAKGYQIDRSGALRDGASAARDPEELPTPARAPRETSDDARMAEASAVAEASAAFSRAYVAGDLAAIRSLYTHDALLLPPGGRVQGVERIVRYFAPGPGRENLSHAMRSERVEIFDSVAVDAGTWSNTWRVDGGPVREASDRYLVVWRRGDDGRWRIAYDVWHRPSG